MSSESLEVALVTPWDTGGGIANYSERLRSALKTAGHSVTVVPILNPESGNPFGFGDVVRRIPSGADVVHVQFEAGVFGRLLISGVCAPSFYARLARRKWPIVTTLHEVHRNYPDRPTLEAAIVTTRDWLLEHTILFVSDATVVHTAESEAILRDRHGDRHRIEQVRHPVDEPIAPPVHRETAREDLGITADTVLTTFGWVERKKRYQDVIRCLPELPGTEYLIAGEPRHKSDIETLEVVFDLADRLNVQDRVRHLGYVAEEDLPTLFGATDLTIIPYEQVTQSGAANTALAYHCPVVTTSLPAFEELASEYECVLTYDDSDTLHRTIYEATTDGARSLLREAAKRYSETETWSAFSEETVSFYCTVVGEASGSISPQQ